MSLIRTVIDWETAYGKHPETGENISLKVMTTEEYVRHPLFKVHGLGVKIANDRTFYVYGREELLHFLKTHPWEKSMIVAHHAHFDGAICSWRAGIRPAFWGDTLSMSRALFPHESNSLDNTAKLLGRGAKGSELAQFYGKWDLTPEDQEVMGGYCCNDVELTADIFNTTVKQFPVSELRLIDMTVRMFTEPVIVIDQPVLQEEYTREVEAKRLLVKSSGVTEKELASNQQFAGILMDLGVDPPKKVSPSKVKDGRANPDKVGKPPLGILPDFSLGSLTKEQKADPELVASYKKQKKYYPWAYAFGKKDGEFIRLLEHPKEQVQNLVKARLSVKSTIKETRSKRFLEIGQRGAFPVYLNYFAAKTSRWGGADRQNAQNMTRVYSNDPTSGALRRSWTAPEGHLFCVRDSGQIEARKLSYLANQEDALQVFVENGDPYNRLASKIFRYEVDRKLPQFQLEGMVGKAGELGCGYGQGWVGFQENLRAGFMGAPPVVFTQENALAMGASLDSFCYQKSYKEGFGTLRDQALFLKPLNQTGEQHLWHCAATKAIVDGYRTDKPKVVALWKEADRALLAILTGQEIPVGHRGMVTTYKGGLKLPGGIRIQYPQITKGKDGFRYCSNVQRKEWSKLYGALVVENIVQGLSRLIVSDQMLRVAVHLAKWAQSDPGMIYKVVHMLHDEIVCIVPEYATERTMYMMEIEMATPPPWCPDMPLSSGGGVAKNYGECEH